MYTSPQTEVLRVNTWTKSGRRFVGVRMRIPDIRALPKAAPFAWSSYDLHQEDGHHVWRHTLGAPAPSARSKVDAGWKGDELVGFRVHLPSRVLFYNARDVEDPSRIRTIDRGNIITWEQRLADRLENQPIAWADDRTPGVMEIRMDSQSILYRTLVAVRARVHSRGRGARFLHLDGDAARKQRGQPAGLRSRVFCSPSLSEIFSDERSTRSRNAGSNHSPCSTSSVAMIR